MTPALVVFRPFDGVHDDGQRMGQLVIKLFEERAADQLGDGVFRTLLTDLVVRVHLRPLRGVVDQHLADLVEIVVFQGADGHDVGEVGELVDLDQLVDELLAAQLVDFGDDATAKPSTRTSPSSPLVAKSVRRRLRMRLSARGRFSWSAGSRNAMASISDSDSSTMSLRRWPSSVRGRWMPGVSTSTSARGRW